MRILHTIDSGGLYGAEVMLLALVEEQIKLGLQPVIASIGEKLIEPKPLEVAARQKGIAVEVFQMFPGPNVAGAMKILRYAWRNHFDIIHSHGYKSNVLLGFLPRSIRKLPMVTTHHGYTSTIGFTKNRIYEWLDSIGLRFIDEVVLVNQGMLKQFQKSGSSSAANFVLSTTGYPSRNRLTQSKGYRTQAGDASHPTDAVIRDFCRKGFTIGSIGRLSREKGYELLIDALCRVKERGIDAGLVIIGDGSLSVTSPIMQMREGLRTRFSCPVTDAMLAGSCRFSVCLPFLRTRRGCRSHFWRPCVPGCRSWPLRLAGFRRFSISGKSAAS